MSLPNRQRRLHKLGSSLEADIDAAGEAKAVKLGDTSRYYYVASDEFLAGKAGGVGFAFTQKGAVITPGTLLSFFIDKSKVDFEGVDGRETFNPLAGKLSSDATTPHPIFIPSIFNEDIKELIGMYEQLSALAEAL